MRQWRHTSRRQGQKLLTLLKVAPAAAALLVPGASAFGEIFTSTAGQTFRVSEIVRGLMNPWSLAFLPGGDMLVTERIGRLRMIREGALQPQPVAGVPKVVARSQGGLLDVALHPGFAGNRLVYLSYSGAGQGGVNTEVMRARFDGARLEERR